MRCSHGSERSAAIEAIEVADRGEERLLRDVLGGGGVVHDEVSGVVRTAPVEPEQLVEGSLGPALRAAHERPLISPSRRHPLPTVRRIAAGRSMRVIRNRAPPAEVHWTSRRAGRISSMNRRSFLVAAAAPLVAAARAALLRAATAGGGAVALVTADLESHLVAVDDRLGPDREADRDRAGATQHREQRLRPGARRPYGVRPRSASSTRRHYGSGEVGGSGSPATPRCTRSSASPTSASRSAMRGSGRSRPA